MVAVHAGSGSPRAYPSAPARARGARQAARKMADRRRQRASQDSEDDSDSAASDSADSAGSAARSASPCPLHRAAPGPSPGPGPGPPAARTRGADSAAGAANSPPESECVSEAAGGWSPRGDSELSGALSRARHRRRRQDGASPDPA